jgi:hypothetical protein
MGKWDSAKLKRWWGVALFSFLLLYISLYARIGVGASALSAGSHVENIPLDVLNVLVNLCNNASTLAFLMCFITMQYPMKSDEETRRSWAEIWIGCLVMPTFVEAAVRFQFHEAVDKWPVAWFDLFTGASAGIALAMFSGRLASPLIDPHRSR